MSTTTGYELSIPKFFDHQKVEEIWRVPYEERFADAIAWRAQHGLRAAAKDSYRIALLPIDVQNTFCIPGFEMFVGGQSGRGAVDDNIRLCELIYRNLGVITKIHPTMDTHSAYQIFHAVFWVNDDGEHPAPATVITVEDVQKGVWKVNPAAAYSVTGKAAAYQELQAFALHYVESLANGGKYPLMVWPYHAMLGGIGHALVSSVEEAAFFHAVARNSQTDFQIKGGNPLTENYSVLRPEVLENHKGSQFVTKNEKFIKVLLSYDLVIIAGQAKSHCVAWTIDDLLGEIKQVDPALVEKVYLVEDLTSPVVIPGVIDFTEDAKKAFERFSNEGMHVVQSTTPIADWEGVDADRLAV